jgi:hypothetical protein
MMAEGHRKAARSVIEPGKRGGILKHQSERQMRNEKDSCSPRHGPPSRTMTAAGWMVLYLGQLV